VERKSVAPLVITEQNHEVGSVRYKYF